MRVSKADFVKKDDKVYVLNIDLFFSLCISDNQADAGGRRDWSSILMKQSETPFEDQKETSNIY